MRGRSECLSHPGRIAPAELNYSLDQSKRIENEPVHRELAGLRVRVVGTGSLRDSAIALRSDSMQDLLIIAGRRVLMASPMRPAVAVLSRVTTPAPAGSPTHPPSVYPLPPTRTPPSDCKPAANRVRLNLPAEFSPLASIVRREGRANIYFSEIAITPSRRSWIGCLGRNR
jgi:hypothetical protein